MRRDELAIEQSEAPCPQPRNQMGQRHFRGIRCPAEHRFPKEGPTELDAIKSADQLARFPGFDAVRMPSRMEQCD